MFSAVMIADCNYTGNGYYDDKISKVFVVIYYTDNFLKNLNSNLFLTFDIAHNLCENIYDLNTITWNNE